MLPVVNPSTDPCQSSSHLTSPETTKDCNPPQSLFCSHNHPVRHEYHLLVSQSHVASRNVVSQMEARLTSGAGHVQYHGGCHSCTWRIQRPMKAATLLTKHHCFDVHRMEGTRRCRGDRGLAVLHYAWFEVSWKVCRISSEHSSRVRPEEVRKAKWSSMHNYFISPLVPSADPKCFWKRQWVNGEFQVKGKRGRILLSLLLSHFLKITVYIFFIVFHLSVAVCWSFCSFTVCFWSGCSWLAKIPQWGFSRGKRGLAHGWCGSARGPASG